MRRDTDYPNLSAKEAELLKEEQILSNHIDDIRKSESKITDKIYGNAATSLKKNIFGICAGAIVGGFGLMGLSIQISKRRLHEELEKSDDAFLERLQDAAAQATAPIKPPPIISTVRTFFRLLRGKQS